MVAPNEQRIRSPASSEVEELIEISGGIWPSEQIYSLHNSMEEPTLKVSWSLCFVASWMHPEHWQLSLHIESNHASKGGSAFIPKIYIGASQISAAFLFALGGCLHWNMSRGTLCPNFDFTI